MEGNQISDLVKAMIKVETYVNVHTELRPGGQIRGQIFPKIHALPSVELQEQ